MGFVLTEAEQAYHYGDTLSHYGVKGMRWGKRGAGAGGGPSSGPSRKELRGMDKATKKQDKIDARAASDKRDAAILKKRDNLHKHAEKYDAAVAKYKVEKKQIGKVAAKKALNQATDDFNKAWDAANEPTRKEQNRAVVNAVLFGVGYAAMSALAS